MTAEEIYEALLDIQPDTSDLEHESDNLVFDMIDTCSVKQIEQAEVLAVHCDALKDKICRLIEQIKPTT